MNTIWTGWHIENINLIFFHIFTNVCGLFEYGVYDSFKDHPRGISVIEKYRIYRYRAGPLNINVKS